MGSGVYVGLAVIRGNTVYLYVYLGQQEIIIMLLILFKTPKNIQSDYC